MSKADQHDCVSIYDHFQSYKTPSQVLEACPFFGGIVSYHDPQSNNKTMLKRGEGLLQRKEDLKLFSSALPANYFSASLVLIFT